MTAERKTGYFILSDQAKVQLNPFSTQLKKTVETIIEPLRISSGYRLPLVSDEDSSASELIFEIKTGVLGREGYQLMIDKDQIRLTAEAANGIFYGWQTLLQLLPAEIFTKKKIAHPLRIPCCRILDKPRFGWRGMHLDVSRHFFGVDFIKNYLDLLALHKLNIFHWHLTDDNGWRLEIKKYPKLTAISAWRRNLEHLPWLQREESVSLANGFYGGFYTQEEIKEIVDYAAERFITVVPEIEMPGHSREVFAAYPQFSCLGRKLTVAAGGYSPNIDLFCAGKDKTIFFLKDIITEVMELFPAEYIHIGGDEADKTRWKTCPFCQQRIRNENLKDENELQSWFIRQIAEFLQIHNRKLIGWDEICEGDLNKNSAVMCWRGDGIKAAELAVSKGLDVVMCPSYYLYFDWKQKANDKGAFGVTTLEKVYNYDPVAPGFSAAEAKHILGAQGNVWTEWMPSAEMVEYMALPRMCALSEAVWSSQKNYKNFKKRLDTLKHILKLLQINFNNN